MSEIHDDAASLTGSYALNALSDEEREAVEARLSESEALRHEATELADTAVLLGRAVTPVTPPPALKATIMHLIATTPQLPAQPVSQPVAQPVSEPVAVLQPAPPVVTTASGAASTKAQARWFAKPGVLIAAVAAAAALVVGGGVLVNSLDDSPSTNQAADRLTEITAAADSQRAVADIDGGGTATLVWSNELQRSAMIVDGIPALPSGKVYELWYIDRESVARSAGTFTVGSDGSTERVLDGEMQAGDTVGVTVEPSGGSGVPTTAPIVAIASA